jgi:SAM-dependent methyltransferase
VNAQARGSEDLKQSRHNDGVWARGSFLDYYTFQELRPAETRLFERNHEALSGRVLELGCGAGRVTGHLIRLGGTVRAIDLSPAMIAYCVEKYPDAEFSVGSLTDLGGIATGSFDAIVAPFCVLDVLDDEERAGVLEELARLLVAGGLLIFSTHNRAFAPFNRRPNQILARNPRRVVENLMLLRRRVGNYRRLSPLIREADDYAILVDEAHDFALLHYYISRDAQDRQLRRHGFELLDCLELNGTEVGPGEDAERCPELHYAARKIAQPA